MALPLRLRARPGEPAHGALVRLAVRHREPDVRRFAALYGCRMADVLAGRGAGRIARLAGLDAAELMRHTPALDVPRRVVGLSGEQVLLNDWTTRRRRWCPECLREDRLRTESASSVACWHRAAWDVGSVASCPLHRLALVDLCPSCGSPQGWDGPSIDGCRCGADLALAPAARLQAACGAASDYAAGRLGLGPRRSVPLLDGLALKDVLAQLERLGECALLGHRALKPERSQEGARAAREAGMAVALAWPGAFLAVLDEVLAAARAARAARGMIGSYGWIYAKWAARPMPDGFADEVRGVLAGHARRNGVVPVGERLFGEPQTGTLTLRAVARLFGQGYAGTRRRLAATGMLPGAVRQGVGAPLELRAVSSLQASMSGELELADVGRRLGTARSQTRTIVIGGLLAPVAALPGARRFRASDVDALLERLRSHAPPALAELPDGVSSLPSACKAARVRILVACKAILAGQLPVRGTCSHVPGLRGILVTTADVGALRPVAGFSVEAAAAALHIHHEAVRWLVRSGVLACLPGKKGAAISPRALEAFQHRYVTGADIAVWMGTSSRHAAALLAEQGVASAFGPPLCRQLIYERAALEVAGLDAG